MSRQQGENPKKAKKIGRRQLGSPIEGMCHGRFDLSFKCLGVVLFSDAEDRALIRIAERQCHHLTRNGSQRFCGHATGFEQIRDPLADNAHAGLFESVS